MKNEILMQIINQIKNYDLTEMFQEPEQFRDWASKLNNVQINNFLNLNIAFVDIYYLKSLLINPVLLKCKDYNQRVRALSKLKNIDGCGYLIDKICSLIFLQSKNFYKDIEMISKADTARYALMALKEEVFINSPYHDEDLKMIVETHDVNQDKKLDFIVSSALATVASNLDSINSQYHQADMQLIAKSGSQCLEIYPKKGLNNLAINKESLMDKYHLENMKILANNPIAIDFLYKIMTNHEIIKGKYYRKEVEVLLNAKSKLTARALYYYINNPMQKFDSDPDFYDDYECNISNPIFVYSECTNIKKDNDYINNLVKINEIDDKFVMHYVSLLMNEQFLNSSYKKFDLELLQKVSNRPIFMDLYKLMTCKDSLNSIYHKKDAIIISQTLSNDIRNLLLEKAMNKNSIKSNNHEYDMEYIYNLELNKIDKKIYSVMYYYLFTQEGINDINHIERLEQLSKGILVEKTDILTSYFDFLQKQIKDCKDNSIQIIESNHHSDSKQKIKLINLFKRIIKNK